MVFESSVSALEEVESGDRNRYGRQVSGAREASAGRFFDLAQATHRRRRGESRFLPLDERTALTAARAGLVRSLSLSFAFGGRVE
jgi:hypothetical protein